MTTNHYMLPASSSLRSIADDLSHITSNDVTSHKIIINATVELHRIADSIDHYVGEMRKLRDGDKENVRLSFHLATKIEAALMAADKEPELWAAMFDAIKDVETHQYRRYAVAMDVMCDGHLYTAYAKTEEAKEVGTGVEYTFLRGYVRGGREVEVRDIWNAGEATRLSKARANEIVSIMDQRFRANGSAWGSNWRVMRMYG